MTDRDELSNIELAQVHNIYGTLGVMTKDEIWDEIEWRDRRKENPRDLATIHNIYATLGVMDAESIRSDLDLDEEDDD